MQSEVAKTIHLSKIRCKSKEKNSNSLCFALTIRKKYLILWHKYKRNDVFE